MESRPRRRRRVRLVSAGVVTIVLAVGFVSFDTLTVGTDSEKVFIRRSKDRETARVAGKVLRKTPSTRLNATKSFPPTSVLRSLPGTTAPAEPSTTSTTWSSSTTTLVLPSWQLGEVRLFAEGSVEGRPLPRNVKPSLSRAQANAKASVAASGHRGGGRLEPSRGITALFGEYDAPVGEWLGKVESVETEPRAVWFVVFAGLEGQRSSGVVVRNRDRATVTTPVSAVVTDLLVVIDDDTGEVLIVSEFLGEV